jgi:hypothetical protein
MTTMYSGWRLLPSERTHLLNSLERAGVALLHPVVVCDHVTLSYPADVLPEPARIVVTDIAADAAIQALIVKVDGNWHRPDGGVYHITLSRRADVKDVHSNTMIQLAIYGQQVKTLEPRRIRTEPFLEQVGS